MSRDCQSASVAERRRDAWTIHPISPARAATPSRIHSHRRLEPEPDEAVVGEAAGLVGVAVAVTVAVDVAVAVAVSVAVAVAVAVLVTAGLVASGLVAPAAPAGGVAVIVAALLDRVPIALLAVLPHPVARQPATMTAGRNHPFVKRRMSAPSVSVALRHRVAGPGEIIR